MSEHGGDHAVAAARAHGVQTMFTLSGGHIFPLYDGAVRAQPPMRILDVRHEQTAVFAAEATARLTRTPGLAVLTAGPGVTNGMSAITTAHFNGSPVVVLAGRAPDYRWGSGSLQEFDHPVLLGPITKRAFTEHAAAGITGVRRQRVPAGQRPGIGARCSWTWRWRRCSGRPRCRPPRTRRPAAAAPGPEDVPDPGAIAEIAALLARSSRPVLVLGSDVWLDGAAQAARAAAEELRLPVIANGQGRGILPAGHELLVTRARSAAFGGADLVLVAGTPLDFRLGYGEFGGRDGAPAAQVVHIADAASQLATHRELAAAAAGDLSAFFTGLAATASQSSPWTRDWLPELQAASAQAIAADADLLHSEASPIHPMRIYGELGGLLDDDAVIIGDGGDFVSYAGQVHRAAPARRLARPRPLRLPGHRAGLRDRGPDRPAVQPGGAAAGRRGGGVLADGRGHAGPAQAARGDRLRQQRHLGPGEAPHAGPVRLRRGRRAPARLPV